MKILFFCNLVPNKLGAYETWLVVFARTLQQAGDRMVLAIPGAPHPELARDLADAEVEIREMPHWTDAEGAEHAWAFVAPALRHLRAVRPDIAVVNYGNEWPSLITALLGKCTGHHPVKWVWQQHQQIGDPNALTARLSSIRVLNWVFDLFVAVYDGGGDSMRKRGIPSPRIGVVYNGIREHQVTREAGWLRAELQLPPDTLIFVNTGWLIPRKRVDFILRAFADVRARLATPTALVVVGEGPQSKTLKNLSRILGVESSVHFLGLRNDVRELLAEADVLVHAALAETCTYVISEAMCAGIPSVVTDAGASREQIISGETGFVVEQGDHEGFVRHWVDLSNNAAWREVLGQAARRRWQERYRVEASAETYHRLCRNLIGKSTS